MTKISFEIKYELIFGYLRPNLPGCVGSLTPRHGASSHCG